MTTRISHQLFFPQPPETVWEYLTKPALMELWLMKNDFQPIVGYDFQFTFNPVPALDFDGTFYCRVLEIVPCEKLSYTWACGPREGRITLDSVVVWRLEAKENGTELFLEHSGFSEVENFNMYTALNDGWLKNMHKIADLMNAAENDTTNA
jgi:uncharacterized protein YndB with AHSA1/START domain